MLKGQFELYLPPGPGPHPLVCITPILGRLLFLNDLILERHFGRFFAKKGFACAVIDRPIFEFNPSLGLEQIQHYLDESVLRSKWALDELIQNKAIDPERVGTYGISFGAVVNSLWAAEDPRLKAHVFALPGGYLPEILVASRDPLMKSYIKEISRAKSSPHHTATPEELKAEFQKVIRRDPLDAARKIPKEKVCLHLALFDCVIPFRYGLAFREAMGKPETIFIPLGHYSALLSIPFLKSSVVRFFRKKLG